MNDEQANKSSYKLRFIFVPKWCRAEWETYLNERVSSLWNAEPDEENLGTDRFLLSWGSALSQDVMKE